MDGSNQSHAPQRYTLDPKQDVVFKLIFAAEKNRHLLISLLNAVLRPETPIEHVEVINPDVKPDVVSQHGAVLDVLVRLRNRRQIDVEMQSTFHTALFERFLYYWARAFTDQLSRGQQHDNLMPVVGIFILGFSKLEGTDLHSCFRILETQRHEELTHVLELHFLELPKLPSSVGASSPEDQRLLNWCRFLAAQSDQELETLAMTDPEMRQAKDALDELSRDPVARRLAQDRRLAEFTRAREREEALELGRLGGLQEGRQEGRRTVLLQLLNFRFGDLPAHVEERLASASQHQLDLFTRRILSAPSLDDVFADDE